MSFGNSAMMERNEITLEGLPDSMESLRGEGKTVMFCAVDGALVGAFGVADAIKETTPAGNKTAPRAGLENHYGNRGQSDYSGNGRSAVRNR